MFNDFYGLKEDPFTDTDDPRFFYQNAQHHQSMVNLVKKLKLGAPFLLLTGEEGTGKTAVSNQLSRILSKYTDLSVVKAQPPDDKGMLASICDGYGIPFEREASRVSLFNTLRGYFYLNFKAGRKSVILIENAQTLTDSLLEQLRRLISLVIDRKFIAQIIFVSRTEILSRLGRTELNSISRYITAHSCIKPLTTDDVARYIKFRLKAAGCSNEIFDYSALKMISTLSGGVPRIVNLIAERCIKECSKIGLRNITTTDVSHASLACENDGDIHEFVVPTDAITKIEDSFLSYKFVFAAMMLTAGIGFGILGSWFYGPVMPLNHKPPRVVVQTIDNSRDFNKAQKLQKGYIKNLKRAEKITKAMKQLFKIWGYNALGISCQNAHYAKLKCYNFSGTLKELINLNHPALVSLYDSSEKIQFYGVITSVGKDTSIVIIGNTYYEVNNTWLYDMWDGKAVILWRTLPSGSSRLAENSNPTDFAYMSRALSRGTGRQQKNYERFTPEMVEAIKEFQVKEHLTPDGRVETKTIMLLNARGGAVMPRLIPFDKS